MTTLRRGRRRRPAPSSYPQAQNPAPNNGRPPEGGVITRSGIVRFGALAGGVVGTFAAWSTGPTLAVLIGTFAALGAAASLHELLPKHW